MNNIQVRELVCMHVLHCSYYSSTLLSVGMNPPCWFRSITHSPFGHIIRQRLVNCARLVPKVHVTRQRHRGDGQHVTVQLIQQVRQQHQQQHVSSIATHPLVPWLAVFRLICTELNRWDINIQADYCTPTCTTPCCLPSYLHRIKPVGHQHTGRLLYTHLYHSLLSSVLPAQN